VIPISVFSSPNTDRSTIQDLDRPLRFDRFQNFLHRSYIN
jgi:hypothetical protein